MADDPAVRPGVHSEVLAHTDELRFTVYTLDPGGEIPWHFHSDVADWYIGREGLITVESRSPDTSVTLAAGEMHRMPVRRVHRVVNTGDGVGRFALVQGWGTYDFNPVTD